MNFIIFPTQLYNIKIDKKYTIYLIEDPRYFIDFKFHKLKLAYHRATMKKYYDNLKKKKYNVKYIEYHNVTNTFYKNLKEITLYDFYDKKLYDKLDKLVTLNILPNIQFLINQSDIDKFKNKKYQHDTFYKYIRDKYDILPNNKLSYDKENRLNLPKNIKLPENPNNKNNKYINEAKEYINKHFKTNYGSLDHFIYPIDHKTSIEWLNNFLKNKLINFGKYQDAVTTDSDFVFHSVISPMMNIGLLLDKDVLDISNTFYLKHKDKIPIASYEGFIRQVIGWRQYVYMLYVLESEKMRQSNRFNHRSKINDKLWNPINIEPIDYLIEKIKKYAYVHHIERLMYLSNWLLINQIDPDEVYRIFMEWTIDAYDWVMVANVYGMGQSSTDTMMTRVYFSSSNYILKMSNFKKGEWCKIWDAIYYKFIEKHKNVLSKNYATAMQVKHYNNKTKEEKDEFTKIINNYKK